MVGEGQLQYLEELHFRNFLIAVHISSVQEQTDLLLSRISPFFRPHRVIEVGCDFWQFHIAVFILVIFFEDDVDSLPDFLVASYHFNSLIWNQTPLLSFWASTRSQFLEKSQISASISTTFLVWASTKIK